MMEVGLSFCILYTLIATSLGHFGEAEYPLPHAQAYIPQQCYLGPDGGQCFAYMKRYFFNSSSGRCEEFIYGGCAGNGNRFESLKACHLVCSCNLKPETGVCRGHMRRFYYSPADGCCKPFIYGGCGGNANNFYSWAHCTNTCGYRFGSWSWNKDRKKTGSAKGSYWPRWPTMSDNGKSNGGYDSNGGWLLSLLLLQDQ